MADHAPRVGARGEIVAAKLRYYIQRGLLRAPELRGPHTEDDSEHLLVLRAGGALAIRSIAATLPSNTPHTAARGARAARTSGLRSSPPSASGIKARCALASNDMRSA
jgi:hypothetical protein